MTAGELLTKLLIACREDSRIRDVKVVVKTDAHTVHRDLRLGTVNVDDVPTRFLIITKD